MTTLPHRGSLLAIVAALACGVKAPPRPPTRDVAPPQEAPPASKPPGPGAPAAPTGPASGEVVR